MPWLLISRLRCAALRWVLLVLGEPGPFTCRSQTTASCHPSPIAAVIFDVGEFSLACAPHQKREPPTAPANGRPAIGDCGEGGAPVYACSRLGRQPAHSRCVSRHSLQEGGFVTKSSSCGPPSKSEAPERSGVQGPATAAWAAGELCAWIALPGQHGSHAGSGDGDGEGSHWVAWCRLWRNNTSTRRGVAATMP